MNLFVQYIGLPLAKYLAGKLVEAIVDVYKDELAKESDKIKTEHQLERKALVSAISKASTNEERKSLSILLAKHAGILPNNNH